LLLFERTTRSLTLTPDGRHAVAVAREVVRDFRLALETIARRAQSRRSRVTIAALPSIACAILPRAVHGLLSEHPHTQVGVQDVLHERALGLVADGLADMALTIRPAKLDDLSFEELGSDPVHLVCRADHPLAGSRKVQWQDLARYPFVGLARTSSVRRLTDAAFTLGELAVEPAYEVEQIPSAAALVEAGLGVTALPALTLAMFKGTGLVVRPLTGPLMHRHVGVVTLSGRSLSGQATTLVVHLRKSFAHAAFAPV
jgi:LysR family carnitine catabolism transcriptional activator